MLHPTNQALVDALESAPELDGRFTDITFVNYDQNTGEKRGYFSLVFSATDKITGHKVALKFYDLHPDRQNDPYRKAAFRREHDILKTLVAVDRCLQLAGGVSTISTYDLTGGPGLVLRCEYFAVEWIEDDIDDFFLDQGNHAAAVKLRLYNEIVLAAEALHRHQVFHRDLKAENLRAYQAALRTIVVAIDLGTAARFESGYLASSYGCQVGDYAYAAPEALCGLAGNRKIAYLADVYALGCLLFEMFNHDTYYDAVRQKNPRLDIRLAAMQQQGYAAGASDEEQLNEWKRAARKFLVGITPTGIEAPGSSCPAAVTSLLSSLVDALCHPNFESRANLVWARRRVWTAIRVLENEKLSAARVKAARANRQRRRDAALAKIQRHALQRLSTC